MLLLYSDEAFAFDCNPSFITEPNSEEIENDNNNNNFEWKKKEEDIFFFFGGHQRVKLPRPTAYE